MKRLSLLLFAVASLALAQEAREPIMPTRQQTPEYPPCSAEAVVGQPCIWQPANAPMTGDIDLYINGPKQPTSRDAWVYIEKTTALDPRWTDPLVISRVGFTVVVEYWQGADCRSIDRFGTEAATFSRTRSCDSPPVCTYGGAYTNGFIPCPAWTPTP